MSQMPKINCAEDFDQKKIAKINPENIFLFKVNKRNTRKKFEVCSKLTMKVEKYRSGHKA